MPTTNLATQGSNPETFFQRVIALETAVTLDEGIMLVNAAPAVLSADGASPVFGSVLITKAGVAAITLAAPVSGAPPTGHDGDQLTITDTTGYAHTVTVPTNNINGNTTVFTFPGTAGASLSLVAKSGVWYEQNMQVNAPPHVLSANGASALVGSVLITKGSAAAITLAAPVSGAPPAGHDGDQLTITDTTGYAHTVTTSANKINGNTDTFTFPGTAGTSLSLVAKTGIWYAQHLDGGALTEV